VWKGGVVNARSVVRWCAWTIICVIRWCSGYLTPRWLSPDHRIGFFYVILLREVVSALAGVLADHCGSIRPMSTERSPFQKVGLWR